MMTKEKSPPLRKVKYLAVIPMIVLLTLMFNCTDRTTVITEPETDAEELASPPTLPVPVNENDEVTFVFVEEQATFQGGDLDDFREWVQENIVYPPEALEENIFGRITVQFAVSSQGEVKDVVILRGVDELLDSETRRVILSSPKWVSAKQGGRNVAQQFTIPVVFTVSQ